MGNFWGGSMRTTISVLILAAAFGITCLSVAHADDANQVLDNKRKAELLRRLYTASQTYFIVTAGKSPSKLDEVTPYLEDKDFANKIQKDFDLSLFGRQVLQLTREQRDMLVMAYEKQVPKSGGLVLFYSGNVKTLNAKEFRKFVQLKK